MDLTGTHTYDASLDSVIAMLCDREATVAKYESMKHHDVEVLECEDGPASLHLLVSRVVDVDLPGFAKKVLKPTNIMRQTDEWKRGEDGSWAGTFDVAVTGAPIHIFGTMTLAADGNKTVHAVKLSVDVKVPFIGGRIADWAGKNDVRRSLDGEFAFNDKWLAEHTAPATAKKRSSRA